MKALIQKSWAYMSRTTEDARPHFLILGILLVVHIFLYFTNKYFSSTFLYENLPLRLVECCLGILLIARKLWPKWLITLSPIVWYGTLLYAMPFFFSFMLFKNFDSSIWKVNGMLGLILLAIFVSDWIPYFIMTSLGIGIAWIAYHLTAENIHIYNDRFAVFLTYAISVIYCLLFLHSRELVHKIKAELKAKLEAQKRISEEVAHDIRSPLTALRFATEDLSMLPENKRVMIRNSTTRVSDIANNLLINLEETKTGHIGKRIPVLLSTTLDQMLSEKRTQYSNQNIEFELNIPHPLMTLFVNVQPIEFKRVLSNLINNSVEAFKKKEGTITLTLTREKDLVTIQLIDNGCGIPPKLLQKIFEKGQSFGKKGGHGLGLSHAKRTINLWEGEITVSSELKKGTTITILLPAEKEPPKWFAPKINVPENTTVVVIDDDDSIHLVWKERFKDSLTKDLINLISFRSLDKFTEWFQQNQNSSYFLLIDYEFKNTNTTGPEILKKLRVPSTQALVVTSHFEELDIHHECIKQELKIVPKNIASSIPINIIGTVMTIAPHASKKPAEPISSEKQKVDLVLIDDDNEVIAAWRDKAKHENKKLVTFPSIKAFLKEADQYDRKTKICVDSDLGSGIKGEIASEDIAKLGFKRIHLCTGYSNNPERFAKYPWIIHIQGKEPLF